MGPFNGFLFVTVIVRNPNIICFNVYWFEFTQIEFLGGKPKIHAKVVLIYQLQTCKVFGL